MYRLNEFMTEKDMIVIMCDGNARCISAMFDMLTQDSRRAKKTFIFLDHIRVYGEMIYKLWNDCCNRDVKKVFETIDAFELGDFTKEEIHKNLSKISPEPFIR